MESKFELLKLTVSIWIELILLRISTLSMSYLNTKEILPKL